MHLAISRWYSGWGMSMVANWLGDAEKFISIAFQIPSFFYNGKNEMK
jgi:hypothetical protein